MSKKQIKKKIDKKCYFCPESDYNLLDVHRILPGAEGGKYTDWNMLTVCACCHRKCHSGRIVVKGKYYSTSGKYVLHCEIDGEEQWI